jgi:hypothetical protein
VRCLYVGQTSVIEIKIHLINIEAVICVCVIAGIGAANAEKLF